MYVQHVVRFYVVCWMGWLGVGVGEGNEVRSWREDGRGIVLGFYGMRGGAYDLPEEISTYTLPLGTNMYPI